MFDLIVQRSFLSTDWPISIICYFLPPFYVNFSSNLDEINSICYAGGEIKAMNVVFFLKLRFIGVLYLMYFHAIIPGYRSTCDMRLVVNASVPYLQMQSPYRSELPAHMVGPLNIHSKAHRIVEHRMLPAQISNHQMVVSPGCYQEMLAQDNLSEVKTTLTCLERRYAGSWNPFVLWSLSHRIKKIKMALQEKYMQHKDTFIARVAREEIDPVLDIFDSSFEQDMVLAEQKMQKAYSAQKMQSITQDVTQQFIQMFHPGDDQYFVADSVQKIADGIFSEARSNGYYVVSAVIDHTYHLIGDIKTATDDTRVVFSLVMAENLLHDIQYQSIAGKYNTVPSFLERARSLLSHAANTFAECLNPITRVQENIDFFAGTARFVSTVVAGRWYLSKDQYAERICGYWDTVSALSPANLANLSMEQWVAIGASVAADVVIGMGITKTVSYLKEIQAVVKTQKKAADVAKKLKCAVSNALKKDPFVVTPQGLVLRASIEKDKIAGSAKEVLKNAEEVYGSFCSGHMVRISADIELAEKMYKETRKGFAECANQFIKPNYKHILGLDHDFNPKNGLPKLGGFHFDKMNIIESSGIIEFRNKVIDSRSGFYKAKLWYNGHYLKESSFFPAHWEAHEVIGCVMEAYDKFKSSGVIPKISPDGKYVIQILVQKDIEVLIHITKNGSMKSAYPILTKTGT